MMKLPIQFLIGQPAIENQELWTARSGANFVGLEIGVRSNAILADKFAGTGVIGSGGKCGFVLNLENTLFYECRHPTNVSPFETDEPAVQDVWRIAASDCCSFEKNPRAFSF